MSAKYSRTHSHSTWPSLSFLSNSLEVWRHRPLLECPCPHLGVLLRHMLLGELGKLHKLGDNLLDIIAVGAVHQGGSHWVQDGLVRGLEGSTEGERQQGNFRTNFCFQTVPSHGLQVYLGGVCGWFGSAQRSTSSTEGEELALLIRSRQKFLLHPQQHSRGNGWESSECAPCFVPLCKAQVNMFSHSVTTSPGAGTGWTRIPSGLALGKLLLTHPSFSGRKDGERSLGWTGTEGGDPEEVRYWLLVLQDLTSWGSLGKKTILLFIFPLPGRHEELWAHFVVR